MAVYEFGKGSRVGGNAQEIGEWLYGLEKRTPEIIVNEAEDEVCPAHGCFTWDDYEAAHKCRLQEARMLVNSIVVVADPGENEFRYPAYESVIVSNERQYVPTTIESLSDEEIWMQIAGDAKQTIRSLQHKLSTYSHMRGEDVHKAQRHLELASEAMHKAQRHLKLASEAIS
jgi:hypothetical protein